MRPSFVIMARFFPRPPWKQGRSHGCTDVRLPPRGHLPNGHNGEQSVPSRSRVRCVSFSPPKSGNKSNTPPASTVAERGSLDTATPHHDCSHHDLVCRGDGRRPFRAVPILLRPDSLPQATATWQGVQRLLQGDAAFAHARLVGLLRCRAVARLPPLGRPHDHGGLVSVGV